MRSVVLKEKNDKMKQWGIGLILVGIMFASVLGYAFLGENKKNIEKIEYNGFIFIKENGFWFTKIGDLQFVFRNNPNEVENIPSYLNSINNYVGKPVYISSKNNEASSEIYQNVYQIVERINPACLSEEDCEKDLPIKTCKDNFIIIEESEISDIRQEENCVFIRGPQEKIIKVVDEFLFKIFGIKQ